MSTKAEDWKKITPKKLIPAISHIRQAFDGAAWNCEQVTLNSCYAALHSALHNRAAPAIFKSFMVTYRSALTVEVEKSFEDILQIGMAHSENLKEHPVEWAKAHLHLLINQRAVGVKRWIKEVCDKQDTSKVHTHQDFEELVFWRGWRAPRLIHMKPSGNTPYYPATAWTREDEPLTQHLLESLSSRFVELLEIDLDKTAGAAHVAFAKRGEFMAQAKQSPSQPADSQQSQESERRASRSNQKPGQAKTKLGPKQQDLSSYLDSAKLTPRQRECLSLVYEHGMRKTDVARYLGIHRKTLHEHLAAAKSRLEAHRAKERADKNLAKVMPGGIRTP